MADKLNRAVSQLTETLENAEKLRAECCFGLKCKKSSSTGIPLSLEAVRDMAGRASVMKDELASDVRVVKAHTLPKQKA